MRTGLNDTLFPFLARVTDSARRELEGLPATRAAARKRLVRRGDAADGAYLIVGGSLRVYYLTAEGREATLYRVEAGGTCVLSVASSLDRVTYPAWVEAGPRGGEYVRIPSTTLHRLLDSENALRQFVFGVLSGRVFELMCALEELGSAQIEQRVARYLLKQLEPDDCVRVSQVGIASDLGTAREVVFRALRSLSQQNVIRTGRMRIQVLDRAALALTAKTTIAR